MEGAALNNALAAGALANPMSLQGRHIVITGASHGIGRGIAAQCVALGATVTAIGRHAGALAELAAALPGSSVHTVAGDVADPALAERVNADATARFGRIHGLVNNAGVSEPAMAVKMTQESWQRVVDVNLSGSFYFLQAVGRHCIAAHEKDGLASSIVNISSDAGRRGTVGQINYAAAKAGVLGLTMSAAREWGRYAVRVNTVCFGFVETRMTEKVSGEKFRQVYLDQIPMRRTSTPAEVAPTVCFLLSDAASYVTGQHLSVNGGMHIGY